MKKVIVIVVIELIIIAVCVCFLRGINSAVNEELLTINKIALVNLDDGVEVNDEHKYYGKDFINELDDNFKITSLEQARRGLENDLYAAYIIIPATFSKNVESINSDLVKSNITYKINQNLNYEVREEVFTDIWMFNDRLSTNIEYVYVDAILKGIHVVQDGADELLENDLRDLQAVLQFAKTDLVVDPEFPDEKHLDNNIEKLNISNLYESMQKLFADFSTEYKVSQASAQQEYDKLIKDMDTVSEKMEGLKTGIGDIANIDETEEYNIEKNEQIDNYISEYNTNLIKWKKNYDQQTINNFDRYMVKCQTYTEQQLKKKKEEHRDYIKKYYESAFAECDIFVKNEIASENQNEFNDNIRNLEIYDVIQILKEEINRLNREIENLNTTIEDMGATIDELHGDYIGNTECIKGVGTRQDVLDRTNDTQVLKALKKDVQLIKRVGQEERNEALRQSITAWLKKDLVYYGSSAESIDELEFDVLNGQDVDQLINDWYDAEVTLSIEPSGESIEEDGMSEKSKTVNKENTEHEKTEEEIRLEERMKILFEKTEDINIVDVESLDSLIDGVVILPISSTIMKKYAELIDSYTSLDTVWTNWNTKLDAFAIDSYGNDEKRNTIEKTFNGNMQKIQMDVNNKSAEYETYVTQANEINSKNLETWEKSIQTANKNTHINIDNNIKNIKNTREQMNITNSDLMSNILSVLPYSRIGELENRNVYSYITSPIVQENISENKLIKDVDEKVGKIQRIENDNIQEITILVFGSIVCTLGIIFLFRQLKRRNRFLQKQDL